HQVTVTVKAARAIPQNLVALSGSDIRILLDWDDNPPAGLIGYFVYRSTTSDGPYDLVNQDPLVNSRFMDSELSSLTHYFYKVTAINSQFIESDYSNTADAYTAEFDDLPTTPDPVTATGAL